MNIKRCGKLQTKEDFNRGLTQPLRAGSGLNRLFIFLFSVFCFLSSACVAETYYAAGRGVEEKGTIWKYANGIWSVHSVISDCSEIFSLVVDKNGNIFAGGNYFNYGTVWKYNGKEWDKGTRLSECSGLYALAIDHKGNIWAGGTGTKNVWRYNGVQWDNGIKLQGCSGIYSTAVDLNGNAWAGGEGKNQVWSFNGTEWDKGTKLSDCTDIFSLYVDKTGVVWAGGRGGKVLWWSASGGKWSLGTILLDSTEVSAFTAANAPGMPGDTTSAVLARPIKRGGASVDPKDRTLTEDSSGQLYAGGAGRNKIWQKKTEIDWSGANLDNCIAVYTIAAGKDKTFSGGWNLERKGKVWGKNKNEWDTGTDIEKCYVIRTLVSAKN